MSKKIIAVTGATGAQGGSLVRSILADKSGDFTVRAITRKPHGDKAKELIKLGVELVVADLDDTASVTKAFQGAYGAFCVTNFWEHFSAEKELAQAKSLADAAKAAGIKHAVWSTLEDTRKLVPISDSRMPTLWLGFVLPMADKKLPGISAEDIGKCAYGIFKRPALIGKTVSIAGEHLTGTEMAEAMSRAFEQPVTYNYVPPEVYRTFGFPGADDLGNMFQYKRDFEKEFCSVRDVAFSRELNPELRTFAQWLAVNKSKIPLG